MKAINTEIDNTIYVGERLGNVLMKIDDLGYEYNLRQQDEFLYFEGIIKKNYLYATKQKDREYLAGLLEKEYKLDKAE